MNTRINASSNTTCDSVLSANISYIAIGPQGTGKSLMLNKIAGEEIFKINTTNVRLPNAKNHSAKSNPDSDYFFDLDISDTDAITNFLSAAGMYKILFFPDNIQKIKEGAEFTGNLRIPDTEVGRINRVLNAHPKIKNNYAIVVNKVDSDDEDTLKEQTRVDFLLKEFNKGINDKASHIDDSKIIFIPEISENTLSDAFTVTPVLDIKGKHFLDFIGRLPVYNTRGIFHIWHYPRDKLYTAGSYVPFVKKLKQMWLRVPVVLVIATLSLYFQLFLFRYFWNYFFGKKEQETDQEDKVNANSEKPAFKPVERNNVIYE